MHREDFDLGYQPEDMHREDFDTGHAPTGFRFRQSTRGATNRYMWSDQNEGEDEDLGMDDVCVNIGRFFRRRALTKKMTEMRRSRPDYPFLEP
ncbi:hypothetical protein IGI04_005705 [Brassica rapa subsp. trilocularis]|uniref:Uncharacterized protein n=2 Tax=Brassica TaxID=3705 RepID=A0ABQ8EAI4_BRANA|nr:hypothetical protein IGI04_005705 [Brassica rapa subsp. trilocularis]KAH0937808.1 hypothetical protein HID58_005269 [Brassica napus]